MRSGSLRLRLIGGGIVALLVALAIAGAGISLLFERHIARTIAGDLDVHLKQLIAGLDVDAEGRLVIARPPADPRFADPFSGLYWQISAEDGQLLRSRSLWDATLPLPADALGPGEVHRDEVAGPAGTRVLMAERQVSVTIGGRAVAVRVAAAVDIARLARARALFTRDLAVALALLGLVLAFATTAQVALGLRPLEGLRRELAEIRAGQRKRLAHDAPSEVQPLVEEVNGLLAMQEREIERSVSRAADLAHGLKTPLAALAADAGRLRERGEGLIARDIEAVGTAMSRHVDRELARARVQGTLRSRTNPVIELAPLVRSLIAILVRTPKGRRVTIEPRIAEGAVMPFERTDLAEVLGNLLDNAVRHARARVRITASTAPASIAVAIEDDGEGIDPARIPVLLERGVRLDRSAEGAGLGLAIVEDVLDAYGWRLELGDSELGGLKATIFPGDAEPGSRGHCTDRGKAAMSSVRADL